jgi:ribose transport system permease protein
VGSNERGARLSALPVAGVKFTVYALCGTLAALSAGRWAGAVAAELDLLGQLRPGVRTGRHRRGDHQIIGGTRMSGGRGKIIGAVIGVLILGVLNNTLNLMNVSPHLQGMVKGLIIVLAVLAQKKD